MSRRSPQHFQVARRGRKVDVTVDPFTCVCFDGHFWHVGTATLRKAGLRGMAIVPKRRHFPGAIVVGSHLPPDGGMFVEALIHETLHVAFPKASERAVHKGAGLLSKVLYRWAMERNAAHARKKRARRG